MESASGKSQDVIACFDRFYKHYACVLKERDEYLENMKMYSSENERLTALNNSLQRDLTAMHEMVENFHQMITQIDSLKESNGVLREKCGTLEEELKTKEKKYQEHLQEQKKENEEKLKLIIHSREKNVESERQRVAGFLEERNKELERLKDVIASAKKEKEDQITVLSMEYENKLAKVQRQKSQILQTAQQATNQDIYRKKLSHMKKAHEEEVDRLKQQMTQLQCQLQAATTPRPQSPQGRATHFSASSIFSTKGKRK